MLRRQSPGRGTRPAWPLRRCLAYAVRAPIPHPIRLALIEGLSGPFANTGEAVFRNLLWAVERVNARGGVRLPGGARPLQLVRYDSKGRPKRRCRCCARAHRPAARASCCRATVGHGGGAGRRASTSTTQREPRARALFLNYSAVDPALTNERCSFWHFRFDAHADMRLAALTDVLRDDRDVAARLPDRPGLQLRPAVCVKRARDDARRAAARHRRSSATSCTRWAA